MHVFTSTWVVLYFNRSFWGLLVVNVIIRSENRLVGESNFLYVFLFFKLNQNYRVSKISSI